MRFSKAFVAAALSAAAIIVQAPRDPQAWVTGLGLLFSAASHGARKDAK
jgi:uncharacterized membrane protein YhhN